MKLKRKIEEQVSWSKNHFFGGNFDTNNVLNFQVQKERLEDLAVRETTRTSEKKQ